MLKRIVEFIRRKNRARLERRQLAKAGGQVSGGWLARVASRVRAKNHARLAHRRAQRHLLASLAANDTAMLEALVFLLKGARQEQRTRADAEEALARRLESVEDRVDAGVRLVTARIQALEARLLTSAHAEDAAVHAPGIAAARQPASDSGANGEIQRAQPQLAVAGQQAQAGVAELSEPGEKGSRRS